VAEIAHHRIPLTPTNIQNPSIAYAHTNLEPLCHTCHNQHHKKAKPTARYITNPDGSISPP